MTYRVVHIITKGAPMGGAQIDTLDIVRHQHETQMVQVIVGNDGLFGQACRDAGIETTVIPMRNRLLDPFGDLLAFIQLVRHLRIVRPHVVHTHTSKAGILGRWAAFLAGVPVIVHTVHIPPVYARQPRLARYVIGVVERSCSRITDHVIAVADTLTAECLERRFGRPGQVSTIGSAIDQGSLEQARTHRPSVRSALGADTDTTVVLAVANLEPRKRLDVLVDAAAAIVRRHPRTLFLLVGAGEIERDLQEQIDRLRLRENVLLLGRRTDVPFLLGAADIFVQTSELEGLSRSLLEAIVSGLPVVASDANATKELVVAGETGYLVPGGDVDALTNRLSELIADPGMRSAFVQSGRPLLTRIWTLDRVATTHDALYQDLVRTRCDEESGNGVLSLDSARST